MFFLIIHIYPIPSFVKESQTPVRLGYLNPCWFGNVAGRLTVSVSETSLAVPEMISGGTASPFIPPKLKMGGAIKEAPLFRISRITWLVITVVRVIADRLFINL